MGHRHVGRDPDGPANRRFGIVQLTLRQQRGAEIAISHDKPIIGRDRLPVGIDGGGVLAHCLQRHTQVAIDRRLAGIDFDGPADEAYGGGRTSALQPDHAEKVMGTGVIRIARQNIAIDRVGFGQPAGPVPHGGILQHRREVVGLVTRQAVPPGATHMPRRTLISDAISSAALSRGCCQNSSSPVNGRA